MMSALLPLAATVVIIIVAIRAARAECGHNPGHMFNADPIVWVLYLALAAALSGAVWLVWALIVIWVLLS